ncbi:MAG: hypothetical protein ACI8RP_000426, partial [Urechidicola sp.]
FVQKFLTSLKVHLELSLAFLYALLISTYLLDNFVVDVMTHNVVVYG